MVINILLFQVEGGIVIKTSLVNDSVFAKFTALEVIFGYERGLVVIEPSIAGQVGFYALIASGIIVLLFPLRSFRYLLGFILVFTSIIITYLLPNLADIPYVKFDGNMFYFKPALGGPLIIALILQGIMAVLNAALFTYSYLNRERH